MVVCPSGRNDANAWVALDKDHQQQATRAAASPLPSILVGVVVRLIDAIRIVEHVPGIVEADAVFLPIARRLGVVPLKMIILHPDYPGVLDLEITMFGD